MLKADRLSDEDLSLLETQIDALVAATPRSARELMSEVVKQNLDRLALGFFEAMVSYPRGEIYLGDDYAHQRCQSDLRAWLADLFGLDVGPGEHTRRRQMEVGAAYARLKVPVPLIMNGFRDLKTSLTSALMGSTSGIDILSPALNLMTLLLDMSLSMITTAYIRHVERVTRSDEALRQHSIGQDLAVERERQRAAMLDWAQDVYYQAQLSTRDRSLKMLSRADFGLWFTHRAEILLGRTAEYESAVDVIDKCDDLVERLNFDINADQAEIMRSVKAELSTLGSLMSLMFDQLIGHNSARDPLTRLLHKQFLASAVSREITLTQQGRPPFCLVAFSLGRMDPRRMDADQQDWEDIVRRSAQIILSMSRSSDAAFRLNDYTILVIRVESSAEDATRLAEEAVMRITAGHLSPTGHTIHGVKVRSLVIEYDGQPDPRQVIRLAEEQLHQLEELTA